MSTNKPLDTNPSDAVTGLGFMRMLRKGTWEILELIFPKAKALTKPLLLALATVVALPLILAYLAAFWLEVLGDYKNPAVAGVRTWYLETINRGFSIEAVSSRSHQHLDYLHLFEYNMRPSSASAIIQIPITLQPWQKIELEFEWVEQSRIDPTNKRCVLSEESFDLVQVSLEGKQLALLTKGPRKVPIPASWWVENESGFDNGSLVQKLTFRLTDVASRKLDKCAHVHVAGFLRVYKNFVARPEKNQ